MSEADVLYSDIKFTKTKGKKNEATSSFCETTYSEINILKNEPGPPAVSQQVASNEGSKVKPASVALVILCVLLAALIIAFSYVYFDNIKTKKSLQTLKGQHAAAITNLTEHFSKKMPTPPSCPQIPEPKTSDTCKKCDEDWVQHGGNCYFFSTDKLSWEESRRSCQNRGGDLVTINSLEEQKFLTEELVKKMVTSTDEDKFWIGLSDSKEEGKWVWVDGSALDTSLSFWLHPEPDNWTNNGRNPAGEDCVRMGEKFTINNCWYDTNCENSQRRICEKNAQPGKVTCV